MRKKPKRPFPERVLENVRLKLEVQGFSLAKTQAYVVQVCLMHPVHKPSILAGCPVLLRTLVVSELDAIKARRESKAKKEREERRKIAAVQKEARDLRIKDLQDAHKQAKASGGGVIFLCSLSPEERDLIASKDERRQSIDLRKTSLKSPAVKLALGCTQTELDRWSTDGRLPVLFRRKQISDFGRSAQTRYWSPSVIEDALSLIGEWREEDKEKARRNRSAVAKQATRKR